MKIYLCFENNFTGLGSFFDSERLYLLIEKKIKHKLIVRIDQEAKNMPRPKGGNEISQRHRDKPILLF